MKNNTESIVNKLKPAKLEQSKESIELSKDVLKTMVDNYVDEQGNLLEVADFELSSNPLLKEEIRKIDYIKHGQWDNDINNFICRPENSKLVFSQIEHQPNFFEKVKYIKLFHDSINTMMNLSHGDAYGRFNDHDKENLLLNFKKLLEKEDNYFTRAYQETLLKDLVNNYFVNDLEPDYIMEDGDSEAIDFYDNFKEFNDKKYGSFLEQHNSSYNKNQFIFSDEMINKLNLESRDYGAPSSIEDSFDADHYSIAGDTPGTNGGYGDYVTIDLAPKLVGVYAMDGSLIGWNEFNKDEKNPITLNSAVKIKDKIEFEKYPEDLSMFKILSSLQFRQKVKNDFGINLGDYNLRTQYQFLKFIKEADKGEIEKVNNFFHQKINNDFLANKVKSFLSLEVDFNNGNRILEISKNLGKQSDVIFNKIGELVDLAVKETSDLKSCLLKDDNIGLSGIQKNLLKKSDEIITKFSDNLSKGGVNKELTIEKLLEDLENNKIEIELLAATLKSAKEENLKLGINDFLSLDMDINSYKEDLSEIQKKQILDLAKKNWQTLGNNGMTKAMLEDLSSELKDTRNQKYYILKYADEIIGLLRFKPTDHNTLYFASFNVNKDLRGLSIGNQMMELALNKERENNVLEAAADVKIPALSAYIEKFGFVVTGIAENFHGSGETFAFIKSDSKQNKKYDSRIESKSNSGDFSKEILSKQAISLGDLNEVFGAKKIILKCNLTKDLEGYKKALVRLIPKINDNYQLLESSDEKYSMTRYWRDKEGKDDIAYVVLEKNNIQEKKLAA